MVVVQIDSTQQVAVALARIITKACEQGQNVLWLTCGGSNVGTAVLASQLIPYQLKPLITLTLTDERYGPVRHANSNWQQLIESNFLFGGMQQLPILRQNLTVDETTVEFERNLRHAFIANNYFVGLYGVGNNGLVAGIMPGSFVCSEQDRLVTHYEASPFHYITTTPPVFSRLNVAMLYGQGPSKYQVMHALNQQAEVRYLPAELIKSAQQYFIYHRP